MSMMWNEIKEQPEVLARCLNSSEETVARILADVRQKQVHTIVIAARGTSDHAAVYGKYIFEILTGLPVVLAAPSVVTMYHAHPRFEHTLVIGISQSGKASDVAEVLRAANACGAITVGITNFTDSPLAQLAAHHLFCDAGLEKSVAATKTFSAQMMLLAHLAVRMAGENEVLEALTKVPALVERTLEKMDEIGRVAQRYRFIKDCLVLARGFNYPVALETALKIQETSYVRAKAFATSDFHHGPLAIIEKDLPVLLYAPSGPVLDDVLELLQKILDAGADVLVVSDREDICARGSVSVLVPRAESDLTSPFVNAAFAQMFACRLSLLKGLNPDNPRMLSKVTRTL